MFIYNHVKNREYITLLHTNRKKGAALHPRTKVRGVRADQP